MSGSSNSAALAEVCMTQEAARGACNRAYQHAQAMLANNETVLITCGPAAEPVGVKQRRFLHGVVLRQVAEQAKVDGTRYTIDIWKEYYRRKFVGENGFRWVSARIPRWDAELCRLVQPKHATPRRERISTEELGQRAYAKFIDEIIHDATTELGVIFNLEETAT